MSKKFNSQTLMAIGVLAVSFIALFVSVRQTSIMSEQTRLLVEQNKASAWPRLEIGLSKSFIGNREDGFKISRFMVKINNKGTGPAIVESVRVLFDGKPANDWGEFYHLIGVPDSIPKGHSNSTIMNNVIASNEELIMLNLTNNPALMEYIYQYADKFSMEICYKSVYDDHWIAKRQGFYSGIDDVTTEKISGCQVSAQELFLE